MAKEPTPRPAGITKPPPPPPHPRRDAPNPLTDEERDQLAERLINSIGPLLEKACSPNRIGFVVSIGRDADNLSTACNVSFPSLLKMLDGLRDGIEAASKKIAEDAAGLPSAQ